VTQERSIKEKSIANFMQTNIESYTINATYDYKEHLLENVEFTIIVMHSYR
jgi:hypothetical protein